MRPRLLVVLPLGFACAAAPAAVPDAHAVFGDSGAPYHQFERSSFAPGSGARRSAKAISSSGRELSQRTANYMVARADRVGRKLEGDSDHDDHSSGDCTLGYCGAPSTSPTAAPAALQDDATEDCELCDAYEAWDGTGDCPEMPTFVYDMTMDDDERRFTKPLKVKDGCWFALQQGPKTESFLEFAGFNETNDRGNLPTLLFEWEIYGDVVTPLHLFSFRFLPFDNAISGRMYDWYSWSPVFEGVMQVYEDEGAQDFYHCVRCGNSVQSCTCYGPDYDFRTFDGRGTLGVSHNSLYNDFDQTTLLKMSQVFTYHAILASELAAVKALYVENCLPWKAPEGWNWEEYQSEDSEIVETELSVREKPYCDWWPDMTLEGLVDITTEHCDAIPGLLCDADGFVVDMFLTEAGLRGELAADFKLTGVQVLMLDRNRLSGQIPQWVKEASTLTEIELSNNQFEGDLACMPALKNLKHLYLGKNKLTGPIPECFFTDHPMLQALNLERNDLDGSIPEAISNAQALSLLDLKATGISGALPIGLTKLKMLTLIDVSQNFLEGEMSSEFVNSLTSLYSLDVSYNLLTGSLPTISCCLPLLRSLDFSHNQFTGSISTAQFEQFAENQVRSARSFWSVEGNDLSGPLPSLIQSFYFDAGNKLTAMSVKGNHFRCSKDSENQYFEEWVHFMDEDLGICAPVAHPMTCVSSTTGDAVYPGDTLLVGGALFQASKELKCKFAFADSDEVAVSRALYYTTTEVRCVLPSDAPHGDATVTVANHGDDYASSETVTDFAEVTFIVAAATAAPAVSDTSEEVVSAAAIGGIAVAALVALVTLCACGYLVSRERAGKPMFMPLLSNELNTMHQPQDATELNYSVELADLDEHTKTLPELTDVRV